ncbi:hypothetical protein MARINON1_20052 [Marinobacter salarius]|nr:hypothetical protein MBHK15_90053 [Marinobacter salarius]VXA92672.1 hypothetical protein MARINON1_20052 [Marinobacter salarius]
MFLYEGKFEPIFNLPTFCLRLYDRLTVTPVNHARHFTNIPTNRGCLIWYDANNASSKEEMK